MTISHFTPNARDSMKTRTMATHNGLPMMPLAHHVTTVLFHLLLLPLHLLVAVLLAVPSSEAVTYRILPAVLDPPRNISITAITPHRATIKWTVSELQAERVSRFEMTIIPSGRSRQFDQKSVTDIDGKARSFTFQELHSETEYTIYIIAYSGGGMSNRSDVITFRTTADITPEIRPIRVLPGEVVLVVIVIIAWFCAIALFLHKWGTIRILQPGEPRYKHNPKNLETIKVVKRPTDSVIYRSYPKQLSKTMLAREKRIERMNTMPNIKLGEVSQNTKKEKFKSSLPVIEMEDLIPESTSCFQMTRSREKLKSSLPIIETEELIPEPSTSQAVTIEKIP